MKQSLSHKCEVCRKERPRYAMSSVMIFSREYIGEVQVCDFCFVDDTGKRLRKYDGLRGFIRKRAVEKFERQHPDEWLTCRCHEGKDNNVEHLIGCPAHEN